MHGVVNCNHYTQGYLIVYLTKGMCDVYPWHSLISWQATYVGGELFHIEDIGSNEEEEDEEDDEEEGHHLPRPPVQEVRPGDHLNR